MEQSEAEIDQLKVKISEAEGLIQPYLMPNAPVINEYLTGTATLFRGDRIQDRKLLAEVLDAILIYATGQVVLRFRAETVFTPVSEYHLDPEGGQPHDLAKDRAVFLEAERQRNKSRLTRDKHSTVVEQEGKRYYVPLRSVAVDPAAKSPAKPPKGRKKRQKTSVGDPSGI